MLQREIVKNRDMQQIQQSMTEGPVCEFDGVHDKIEAKRKKEGCSSKTGCEQGQAA